MKYLVLVIVGLVFIAIIAYGELTFDDPEFRAEQRRAAEQTLVIVGTQEGTMLALQATIEAAQPIQTQFVAAIREQDYLLQTQDAIRNGTIIAPATATLALPTPRPQDTFSNGSSVISSNYANITTATDIDDNGCAIGSSRQFDFNSAGDGPSVYLVTRARNVSPGTTFQSRWYPTDALMQPYESVSWTADTNYTETCVYFWMEPADIPYMPGSWTVELIVNNTTVQSLNFTLCETGGTCD